MDLLLWTDTYRTTTKSLTAKFPTDEIVSIGPSISQSTSERSKGHFGAKHFRSLSSQNHADRHEILSVNVDAHDIQFVLSTLTLHRFRF
jgi:hypothetical protein